MKTGQKKNKIIAFLFSAVLCVVIGIFFDYYYDLNDDVLMKDILAGVYTGVPEGHNIQMLYPISLFLSLFYRILRTVPWYGIFLCLCQFGSIFLITERLLTFAENRIKKAALLLLEAGMITALILKELVFVQYTVTCTLLAAAAAFRFFTQETVASPKKFFQDNILNIVLVVLAFQIRSEMLLLVFPLICVAGLCKWAAEKPVFTKENAAKYFSVFGVMLAGIIASQGIDMVAYGGTQWRQFTDFFDNRTEVYDFLGIPPYEGNVAFYESIGLSESEQVLLENYNFGLDEEIDHVLLGKISEYADELRTANTTFKDTLKKAVINYKYRTFHETDYPWNLLVITGYVLVLLAALWNRHFRFLWELPCLGVVRTGLWMYILYRGRDPERITHSLYLMEFLILMGMLLWECKSTEKMPKLFKTGIFLILFVEVLLPIGSGVSKVRTEFDRREAVNEKMAAFREYAGEREENFYFLDVYSTVAYSEKLFVSVDNRLDNYDIMGGWASKSPLMVKKYAAFGIQDMETALTENNGVFVVASAGVKEGYLNIQEWLPAYYAGHGMSVTLKKEDTIYMGEEAVFVVYRVSVN